MPSVCSFRTNEGGVHSWAVRLGALPELEILKYYFQEHSLSLFQLSFKVGQQRGLFDDRTCDMGDMLAEPV